MREVLSNGVVDKVEPAHVVPAKILRTQPGLVWRADHEAFAPERAIHDVRDRENYLECSDDDEKVPHIYCT